MNIKGNMDDNYPLGAANDPNAPWNQVDPVELDVRVSASNTLSRQATIAVTDYTSEVDYDDDGHPFNSIDFSSCNFKEGFESSYYSVKELLEQFSIEVEKLNSVGLTDEGLRRLNRLAREAETWEEDEFEVVED